jgi:hypothetical protein
MSNFAEINDLLEKINSNAIYDKADPTFEIRTITSISSSQMSFTFSCGGSVANAGVTFSFSREHEDDRYVDYVILNKTDVSCTDPKLVPAIKAEAVVYGIPYLLNVVKKVHERNN